MRVNNEGRQEFFVYDIYKAKFPATKRYYLKSQVPIAKSFKAELINGDIFEVGILKIQNRKFFVGKIPIEDTTSSDND